MDRILMADIFGTTDALVELAAALGDRTGIIDPYAGQFMDFGDEATAYAHFMAHVGIEAYGKTVKAALASIDTPTELIGFSVGASAIWTLAESLPPAIIRARLFYGSQIRHHTEIDPGIDMELILPAFEPGFDVDELAENLAGKKRVVISRCAYLHGFMNRRSANFDPAGYDHFVDWIVST